MNSSLSMHYNTVLMFGLILIFGYIAGKIANFIKLPKITGYIAVGVLLEPTFLGVIPGDFIKNSGKYIR